MTITHDRIWAAIDVLARRNGLSPSGLARKAGMDATTFNKSKRTSADGRDRWPSTETLFKVLEVTGTSLMQFAASFGEAETISYGGIHLRDYFAGQALIAIPHIGCGCDLERHEIAQEAFAMADAMLKAREVSHDQ